MYCKTLYSEHRINGAAETSIREEEGKVELDGVLVFVGGDKGPAMAAAAADADEVAKLLPRVRSFETTPLALVQT